ncbi:MAG TPA: DedA family protein [Burkholderiales bacterium]|nr:DedA family protein [Burkholderiales bacterium]
MEWLAAFVDLIVHLDEHLLWLAQTYGAWIYAVLFLIVFCETGLVVTPFLPGDSLLFVAGTIAGAGEMNVHLMAGLLVLAAVLGDSLNYAIGQYLGPRVFRYEDSWFFRKAYLERTHAFFERHGGKTIVIARFVPIVRTYAPFVAGIGRMQYGRFLMFNVSGALLWVVLLTYAGYLFGNVPVIKDNLTLVIVVIILLSISPGIIEVLRHRAAARAAQGRRPD